MFYRSGDSSTITAMGNTFSCLNVHCVFSTKERIPILNPEVRERLWPYLGGIAKQNGIQPECIGGVADHVHVLLSLGLASRSTVPPGRVHFSLVSRHFVPGRLRRLRRARQPGVCATTLCGRDVGFAESGYPRFNPSGINA